ncbi:hypothetical protein LX32DRAFT_315991 [Colletotrichum zoysiae]|uniref:Uncharacterized protein n=1 Tax=Colletotrichum zoysiae TaxID=1216348 RepID=A0AAD9H2E5_9PEZI|nr:hypothetical protein LX32DRAFT_315991 [Colletotrichum zoysiae]
MAMWPPCQRQPQHIMENHRLGINGSPVGCPRLSVCVHFRPCNMPTGHFMSMPVDHLEDSQGPSSFGRGAFGYLCLPHKWDRITSSNATRLNGSRVSFACQGPRSERKPGRKATIRQLGPQYASGRLAYIVPILDQWPCCRDRASPILQEPYRPIIKLSIRVR